MASFIFLAFPVITVLSTAYNILLLFLRPLTGKKKLTVFILELVCIGFGIFCTLLYCSAINIRFSDWSVQLYNGDKHTPIFTKSLATFIALIAVSILGYIILKTVKINNMPPLCGVLCIAALYLGIAECILWCIQVSKEPEVLYFVLPANLIIIFTRTIRDVILEQSEAADCKEDDVGLITRVFKNAKNWPWLALIFTVPLLGIIMIFMLLFGQKPDYVIRMWTETTDWTMSTKIPPQNIFYDEHYLCTVAAGGHRKVVKPIRVGLRHGHRVIVNRQLMVANAFEQLLEERTPRFHKFVRTTYDNLGYPIAKHIKSKFTADIIYFIMKPLEWMFLAVLYLFEKKPENRIAVQYPHSKPPVLN